FLINYHNIDVIFLHNRLRFCIQKDIINVFKKDDTWLYLGNTEKYYSLKQTLESLDITDTDLMTVRKENNLTFYNFHNTTYYLKDDVDYLLIIQKSITKNYVPSSLVSETLGEHYYKQFIDRKIPKGIERYANFNAVSQISLLFSKTEYEEFLELKQYQNQIDSISYNDPLLAFYKLLDIRNIEFSTKQNITKEYWMDFCSDYILYNNKSKETVPYFVNSLVKCTKLLLDFTLGSELHLKSTNEINIGLLNSKVPITHQNIMKSFINKTYYRLIQDNIKSSLQINKIKNLSNTTRVLNQDMNMYDYTTFKEVYSYVNNLNHKEIAINDGLRRMKLPISEQSLDYAYSWLYILLHLNNAWRHRDICNIKMINISFLKINSLEEFFNRDLTNDEVNKIINL